jgi:hypothetical protein
MTWKEFILTLRGWQKKGWKEWEKVRLIAYVQASSNNRSKRKLPKIERWMPLPLDKEGREIQSEQLKTVFEKARLKHSNNVNAGNQG